MRFFESILKIENDFFPRLAANGSNGRLAEYSVICFAVFYLLYNDRSVVCVNYRRFFSRIFAFGVYFYAVCRKNVSENNVGSSARADGNDRLAFEIGIIDCAAFAL